MNGLILKCYHFYRNNSLTGCFNADPPHNLRLVIIRLQNKFVEKFIYHFWEESPVLALCNKGKSKIKKKLKDVKICSFLITRIKKDRPVKGCLYKANIRQNLPCVSFFSR